jgi:hypothetical protein
VDERSNAVDSLEKFCEFVEKIEEDEWNLKWAIIAADNALYGFMICAINYYSCNPKSVVDPRRSGVSKESLKVGAPISILDINEWKMISFEDALKEMIQSPYLRILIDEKDKQQLLIFHRNLRGQFEHFVPIGLDLYYRAAEGPFKIITKLINKIVCVDGGRSFFAIHTGFGPSPLEPRVRAALEKLYCSLGVEGKPLSKDQ